MEEKNKTFGYGLSVTLATIVIGLVSYIYYTSNILPNKQPPRCEYGGWAYADKETFESLDGCNTCFCHTGEIICTERECIEDVDVPSEKEQEENI
ncbi:hypothetical protein GX888_03640 [Candidatus Dojkabacteria bacterium]|uniref:Pacifastin domain-containing protein n=1 Tax=Candidatus Dojkabacteria bacterium TaxID=2099670 RepID=A0A847VE51_9BACT|nr:hypothetical protein [Candidatus Dojkabacteria bacterium]